MFSNIDGARWTRVFSIHSSNIWFHHKWLSWEPTEQYTPTKSLDHDDQLRSIFYTIVDLRANLGAKPSFNQASRLDPPLYPRIWTLLSRHNNPSTQLVHQISMLFILANNDRLLNNASRSSIESVNQATKAIKSWTCQKDEIIGVSLGKRYFVLRGARAPNEAVTEWSKLTSNKTFPSQNSQ